MSDLSKEIGSYVAKVAAWTFFIGWMAGGGTATFLLYMAGHLR